MIEAVTAQGFPADISASSPSLTFAQASVTKLNYEGSF